ncbi:hypothetical protein ABZW30_36160 [Kitasatospora sp. NPDC004669]|uniref:hypothetical protein n=1 Tax=Kitasatospora sp. NPDC004669 TaxID=3154555 RepID=UPI0033B3B419
MNHLTLRGSVIAAGLLLGTAVVSPSAHALQAATPIACGDTAGLIQAINNLNGPGGTIQLAEDCVYAFSTSVDSTGDALPPISGKITIKGDESSIVRSATTPDFFRLLDVVSTGDLTLHGVQVSGGNADGDGGGIRVQQGGKLTLDESAVTDNKGFDGGGIANAGTLTLHRSNVSGNVADVGAGILNTESGTVTIGHSKINGNQADSNGGGIVNAGSGTLTVEDSVLAHNTARNLAGGAVFNLSKATFTDTEVSDSFAGLDGGAFYNDLKATLDVTGGPIVQNRAGRDGGALNNAGTATLTKVRLKDNVAGRDGGAIHNQTLAGPSTLTLHHTTVVDNTAAVNGGGILNDYGSQVTLDDSRVVHNTPNNCFPLNNIPGCQN